VFQNTGNNSLFSSRQGVYKNIFLVPQYFNHGFYHVQYTLEFILFGDVMLYCSINYHFNLVTNGVPGFHPLQQEAFTSCIIAVQKINGDLFLPISVHDPACVSQLAHALEWSGQVHYFNPNPSSNRWSGATSHLQIKKEILECAVSKKNYVFMVER
jgi:hypothetical protein